MILSLKKSFIRFLRRWKTPSELIDHRFLIARRTFIVSIFQYGLLLTLTCRVLYLQIFKSSKYKLLSDQNSITTILIYPPRGKILDRNSNILADNQRSVNLIVNKRNYLKAKTSIEPLFEILELDVHSRAYIMKKIKNASHRDNILIMQNLSWMQIVKIEEILENFDFATLEVGKIRRYVWGEIFGVAIGYVGILNQKEKQQIGLANIGSFSTGKNGIEKIHEHELRGDFGYKEIEVNAYGSHIRELGYQAPSSGNDIKLNLHLGLQRLSHSILNPEGSSCIVMNAHTGEVLTLCSLPSFDPNKLAQKISHEYWSDIKVGNKLMNRATQSIYAPGSIFKLVTILAALESGVDPNTQLYCSAGPFLGNHFRCWNKDGHGLVHGMTEAIKYSCNHYMYQIAKMAGHNKILEVAAKCGFGLKSNIDLPFEACGFVPSDSWKQAMSSRPWGVADTLNISIGQGAMLATPMQLARFLAAVSNGGNLIVPKLSNTHSLSMERGSEDQDEPIPSVNSSSLICSNPEYLKVIRAGMARCVNEPGGTAYGSRIQNATYTMAGKTSTSQVISKHGRSIDLSSKSISREYRNHALFGAFVPYENPKYVALVVVEHGGGGGMAAAPIAKQLLSYCMDNKV